MAAIDILLPMRNAAPWIVAAWRSLARQSFADWRLLAVDDGSDDASGERLLAAAAGDRRLCLLRQPARGVAAALNRGLAGVQAPVVVRMDADDVCHPRRLELLAAGLGAQASTGVLASRVRMFPPRRVSRTMGGYLAWQNSLLTARAICAERYVECTVTHASAAFRTEVLHRVGGWWEGAGPEDLDLFLRLHAAEVVFAKLPQVLYRWREHAQRETRTSARLAAAAMRSTKARHLAADLRRWGGLGPVHLHGRGRSLKLWRDALQRQGIVRVVALEHRPGAEVSPWPGCALFCFGHPRARARIRARLQGRREGTDYLFVA